MADLATDWEVEDRVRGTSIIVGDGFFQVKEHSSSKRLRKPKFWGATQGPTQKIPGGAPKGFAPALVFRL
jgi:hypothetical protein